jgi:hypothetical protein
MFWLWIWRSMPWYWRLLIELVHWFSLIVPIRKYSIGSSSHCATWLWPCKPCKQPNPLLLDRESAEMPFSQVRLKYASINTTWMQGAVGAMKISANLQPLTHCTAFMSGCSSAEPWWDADSWVDDRLRPCKRISLMPPSHIFNAELSVRVGAQRRRHFLLFCLQTTLTWKEPKLIIKILVGATTILKQGYNVFGGLGDSYQWHYCESLVTDTQSSLIPGTGLYL